MKKCLATLLLMICVLTSTSLLWAADSVPATSTEDYVIGPGDVLAISVWNNEALTKVLTVLPDGKIHFPLIGEVVVGGKTHAIIEKELKKKISGFVPNPELSVMVQQPASMVIYVIGEVQNPGRFSLNANINVLQALAIAGGFNQWAEKNKIEVFRETKGKTKVLKISYDDITKEKKIDQNIRLERGDVVVVP